MTKKGYKLKQGQIVTGEERLINGRHAKHIIVDEFTYPIDKHIELTEKDLKKAIKSLNLDADKCKKCGTKKNWIVIGCNKHYCKCEAKELYKDPRVTQLWENIKNWNDYLNEQRKQLDENPFEKEYKCCIVE